MKKLFAAASVSLVAASGCVGPEGQGNLFVRGSVPIEPPACEVNPGSQLFLARGVLDIGEDLTDANGYVQALQIESEINDRVSFTQAEVEFETDVAQELEGPATPGGGAAPRKSFVGGLVDPGGQAIVFVNTVTEDDARSLQQEPLVTSAGLNPENPERSVRIIARVSIEGTTSSGFTVKTPPFSFPIDLCVGCLTSQIATCPTGTELQVNETCFFGQDVPLNSCQ